MLLDIAEVLQEGTKDLADVVELPRVVEENVQVTGLDPVDVWVHALADKHVCQTDNSLKTNVSYVCSRCLKTFSENLSADFRESFSQKSVSDEEVHLVPDSVVVLEPYIEQAVNLELNPKPVCSEDCKGLCPECGTNLNEASCNCQTERIDPRLEVLKGLLSEDKSE